MLEKACTSAFLLLKQLDYHRVTKGENCLTGKRSAVQICVSSQNGKHTDYQWFTVYKLGWFRKKSALSLCPKSGAFWGILGHLFVRVQALA